MTGLVIRVALLAIIAHAALALIPRDCCVHRAMNLDLTNNTLVNSGGSLPGVTVIQSSSGSLPCGLRVLLKANFERLSKEDCPGCLRFPTCGRRMLKVELFLDGSSVGRNWLFNVGDSRTNNGWGGDSSTQIRDAEVFGLNNNIYFYKSDTCESGPFPTLSNALTNARQVTLYISNEHVRVITDTGVHHTICSECLFALNGQSDSQGMNQDIYVGLNRVVANLGNVGRGVCRARVSWACTWCQEARSPAPVLGPELAEPSQKFRV